MLLYLRTEPLHQQLVHLGESVLFYHDVENLVQELGGDALLSFLHQSDGGPARGKAGGRMPLRRLAIEHIVTALAALRS